MVSLNPKPILDMNYAFAQTALLIAAVRLGICTHLSGKVLSAEEVARYAETQPGPTQRLLRGLATLSLVQEDNKKYRLTPLAEQFLVVGRESYLGGDTLAMLDYLPAWLQLDQTLRTGTPYRDLSQPDAAEAFFGPRVRDLFPLVYPLARRLVKAYDAACRPTPRQILDVAAGSAAWSIAFVERYPTASVTAIDLPAVVAEGQTQVAEMNLTEHYNWLAQDVLHLDLPESTYDLVLLAHLCRFIGEEDTRALLIRLYRSLRPGGSLVLVDTLQADDHLGPAFALILDLSMLVNTTQGRTFTSGELELYLEQSGFQQVERFDIAGPSPLLLATKGEAEQ